MIAACDVIPSEDSNQAPSVKITSPADGATFSETETIQFTAEASDPDGDMIEGAIAWRSSIDGPFGEGRDVSASSLSPGTHDIWATVHDEQGHADSMSISLSIDGLPFGVEPAFPNLQFDRPTNMVPSPDGERFYVSEQKGVIRVFASDSTTSEAPVFVDLTDRVLLQDPSSAEGLLGFALDPDFEQNGYFYVFYTAAGPNGGRSFNRIKGAGIRTILSRFEATGPTRAVRSSEKVLLDVDQPYRWHNGGQLAFGPDGLLYISLGDGGSSGDPDDRAQNTANLYGTILRIDPDGSTDDLPYGIPPGNPFVGEAGRSEIFAYGLRNVWRFSFSPDGRIWGGDVGQGQWEEIDIIEKGGNYGWDHREGTHCFEPASGCRTDDLIDPIWDYDRAKGRSVVGGYVYRGSRLPGLRGTYVYGDYATKRVWSLSFSGSSATDNRLIARHSTLIASFAEGNDGHLYVLAFDGRIYHLTARDEAS